MGRGEITRRDDPVVDPESNQPLLEKDRIDADCRG